ncbi:GNAT family N-acetyltransferase, partial [Glutamicibacter arilaitensis]
PSGRRCSGPSHAILCFMDTPSSLHRAVCSSASGIIALRDSLARWQQEQSIQQWSPGELSISQVTEQIRHSEWWVSTDGQDVVAAVRLTNNDEHIWPDCNPAAAYIHGLMVHRSLTGQKLGQMILEWAESKLYASGHSIARLDCVATNENLRNYYENLGYRERGVIDFGPDSAWHPVLRFEKDITTAQTVN